MRKLHLLAVIWSISIILGIYQIPLIESTFIKYNKYINLNQYFPYSQNLQQQIENEKISFLSKLDNDKFTNIKELNTTLAKVNKEELNTNNQSKKCIENCKILMIGDSVMGDVSFSLERLLKKSNPSWKIIDAHKVSSGLTNKTYYDWQKTAIQLLEKYKPDYVVVMMGTNDAQGMIINSKPYKITDEIWSNEYKNRVNELTTLIKNNNVNWFWIELPVVKEEKFNTRLQKIRELQASEAQNNLLETESIFGKTNHTEPINMKLRSSDGVHLNATGADLIAKHLLTKLEN